MTDAMRRGSTMSSRRSSISSVDGDAGFPVNLRRGKPVGLVHLTFMGKTLELLVPMNEDINIYDGGSIEGSKEAKAKNSWVEMFDMIDYTMNNIIQQNRDLKRTVNELSSKINKMLFHEKKEDSKAQDTIHDEKKKDVTPVQVTKEINKKIDTKIDRMEQNIMQWIDDETKLLKENVENDITKLRDDVDEKNVDLNAKVQATVASLKEEVAEQVTMIDSKLEETLFNQEFAPVPVSEPELNGIAPSDRQIAALREKLHHNSNLLRYLMSEPLSVQFSMKRDGEFSTMTPRGSDDKGEILPFNQVKCNMGSPHCPVMDTGTSLTVDTVVIPISGTYLLSLGGSVSGAGRGLALCKNDGKMKITEKILTSGASDIVQLKEKDVLTVLVEAGVKVKNINLMGVLLRPKDFITPGTTMGF